MRTLIVLAVIGMCSTHPHQAYNSLSSIYGPPRSPSYQPKWTGPLASSVPAGVNGQIIPVSETYEVSAAKNKFFNAYQQQLAAVGGARRYSAAAAPVVSAPVSSPTYYRPAPPVHHVPASTYSHSAPAVVSVANGHVQDTPEVAAAKSQFFNLFSQQAAAAAAAPDDPPTYHSHYNRRHY